MNSYYELAAAMLGHDPDRIENWTAIDDEFLNKYDITIEEAETIIDDLLRFIMPQEAPLSKKHYQFFAREHPPGIWTSILRQEYCPTQEYSPSQDAENEQTG